MGLSYGTIEDLERRFRDSASDSSFPWRVPPTSASATAAAPTGLASPNIPPPRTPTTHIAPAATFTAQSSPGTGSQASGAARRKAKQANKKKYLERGRGLSPDPRRYQDALRRGIALPELSPGKLPHKQGHRSGPLPDVRARTDAEYLGGSSGVKGSEKGKLFDQKAAVSSSTLSGGDRMASGYPADAGGAAGSSATVGGDVGGSRHGADRGPDGLSGARPHMILFDDGRLRRAPKVRQHDVDISETV